MRHHIVGNETADPRPLAYLRTLPRVRRARARRQMRALLAKVLLAVMAVGFIFLGVSLNIA